MNLKLPEWRATRQAPPLLALNYLTTFLHLFGIVLTAIFGFAVAARIQATLANRRE